MSVALSTPGAAVPRAPAVHPHSRRLRWAVTRRHLQLALAVLWLVDGALQLQGFMFTEGFAHQIIGPVAAGQPAVVAGAVRWAAAVIGSHPVPWDALFASVQLLIGVGLFVRRTARVALVGSIAWALGVWIFGEGLGGVTSGAVTFLAGAPGAALLYAVLSAAAWPTRTGERRGPIGLLSSSDREAPPAWTVGAWAVLWVGFAVLEALPPSSSAGAVAAALRDGATGAPSWVARLEPAIARGAGAVGVWAGVVLVGTELAIGVLALRRGRLRGAAVGAGVVLALAVWVFGQALGQLATGQATDVDSAPLVVLLGIAVWGASAGRSPRCRPQQGDADRPGTRSTAPSP